MKYLESNSFHDTVLNMQTHAAGNVAWIWYMKPRRTVDYRFFAHYHPHVDALIDKLNGEGLARLFDPAYQAGLSRTLAPALYQRGAHVAGAFPREEIDVSDEGPYSIYNWELFFHAPLAIAVHLSKNQRFEEAQRWFHRIFDPTANDASVPAPQRFWKFLRFRNETKPEFIAEMLTALSKAEDSELKLRMETSIAGWRKYPFQPHVVARGRYLAYQLNVLMKYLDNLLAWGDFLFRQDSIESLNEATQIYVLAANLLGPRPQKLPPRRKSAPKSYAQLKAAGIDAFGNALVEMENEFPFNQSQLGDADTSASGAQAVFGIGRSLYFCVPQNDKLLTYWDLVSDRLFKIRHCMNIEGIVRQLPLFDPPIDPGALVRAAAAGMDIASIVNNINQPLSTIRGPMLLQKAIDLCGEVKSLGNALLLAIEKGDAEHLNVLRQQHELNSRKLARDVKFLQWKEAEASTASLLKSRATVWERFRHYKRILGAGDSDIDAVKQLDLVRSTLTEENFDGAYAALVERFTKPLAREAYRKETSVGGLMEFAGNAVVSAFGGQLGQTLPLNKNENAELNIFLPTSDTFSTVAMMMNVAAPILALIPQFNAHGTPLGVGGAVGFGGVQLSKGAKYGAQGAEMVSNAFKSSAERSSRLAGYYRRAEDYVLQANLATAELEQYGRQTISALLREQVLKREYDNHVKAIDDAADEELFLHSKFSNEELYAWMQGELEHTYYDCYKFAFDLAKRAEQTLKYEVMRSEFDQLNLIQFGYWDSGRKGLLAGESLYLDLRRLEMAYLEQNRREYEMTRHVSLARLDPLALLKLKATGACEVSIPEWLFDADSPGQYMRRLKTVALSVPCITGPYTGVHCKLALLRSSVRMSSVAGDTYARAATGDDARFRDFTGAIQSIVTSTGQNDSGLFDVNLRDERYLPFENAGAISTWRIELPKHVPQFDIDTISDVVFHLRYTAREAGNLSAPASAHVKEVLQEPETLFQLFSLNADFGNAWFMFGSAANDASRQLDIGVNKEQFPYWVKRLGMDDTIRATFAVIDWSKNKLTLAPGAADFAGDATAGWSLKIDQGSPLFAFLKKNKGAVVYMAVSYAAPA
ncbi:Tc toxin subunit A-related protein [Massilia scottii]|uniref:Tc toxin subunit A-related protein n=1 Tax=Massilia scottii TaxID=3057166 RepID=UPI002796D085|nr:insecticidal toxin protein [Massilia sp. CCM 9029]MDQ1833710.1 insecticidal toxin protein [Massilia sp. CCM 9029]